MPNKIVADDRLIFKVIFQRKLSLTFLVNHLLAEIHIKRQALFLEKMIKKYFKILSALEISCDWYMYLKH